MVGCFHSVPFFPWYSGIGWTEGIRAWGVVATCLDVPTWSLSSHGTLGLACGVVYPWWDTTIVFLPLIIKSGDTYIMVKYRLGLPASQESFLWYNAMGYPCTVGRRQAMLDIPRFNMCWTALFLNFITYLRYLRSGSSGKTSALSTI